MCPRWGPRRWSLLLLRGFLLWLLLLLCSPGLCLLFLLLLLCLRLLLCSLRLPLLAPPSSSLAPSLSGFVAPGWGSAPAVSMGHPLAPGPQLSLFRPFTVSDPPLLSSASASFSSAAGPLGFASAASGSASGHAGFTPQPGPSSSLPPQSDSSATPSAPPL